jgi:outer membrane lipoprotein-sorting protein
MKPRPLYPVAIAFALATSPAFSAETAAPPTPTQILVNALESWSAALDAGKDAPAQTFSATLEVVKSTGAPKEMAGRSVTVGVQAPDKLLLSAEVDGKTYSTGRRGQELWIYVPDKKFGVVGKRGELRFGTNPDSKDTSKMGAIKLPLPADQMALLPLFLDVKALPEQTADGTGCHVLKITPKPDAVEALKIPKGAFTLWVRTNDLLPARIGYADGGKVEVEVAVRSPKLGAAWPAEKWQIPSRDGDTIETTALSHLTKFIPVAIGSLTEKVSPLGPATGEREVVAVEGRGRFEMIDGTRVVFLKGTPEEMGRQHGMLLKKEIRDTVYHILYGVGVGSSFGKGKWFFGEIEDAQARVSPFIDPKYLQEMDAIALASGRAKEEVRLSNFFPELFHCSGFAIYGEATQGGKLYHGRILDYLKGVGLEQNAVVFVNQPEGANAWVNVSYAGFTGSVTAMNEKKIAIGEMGGRGEGNWDGKPMAQLVREVMEKANTLEEAVAIMRKGPRTCEYYYVISDGNSKKAVGIAATPTKFETVAPGEAHPQLPDPFKDTVLLSAGDRYKKLVERVKDGYGKFDDASARDLMKRPVCMKSNIHSVLFAPETLDFWVANADSENPAAHARYTHYNLGELLKEPAAK